MKNRLSVKIHEGSRRVIAICDPELIGKKFLQGRFQLDVNKHFYEGEEMDEPEVLDIIRFSEQDFPTYNIVGKRSINLCLREDLIDKEGIIKISGIPHSMVF